jgi:hypothetical protein
MRLAGCCCISCKYCCIFVIFFRFVFVLMDQLFSLHSPPRGSDDFQDFSVGDVVEPHHTQ